MRSEPILAQVCTELVAAHAVHTILLYGSRADGSAGADSDYDVAAFGPIDKSFRVARQVVPGSHSSNPSVERTANGGRRLLVPPPSEVPLSAAHLNRWAS